MGRYGGEEFLVIFPNTNQENALIASERIRKMIEEMVREHYFAQEDETPEGEEETPVSADAESKNE